ncbi:MAG: hypothetical protein IME94_11520 [Proteobacteria bacterium]|nr:hypothetical protein [Pseudomonadota bacterium]
MKAELLNLQLAEIQLEKLPSSGLILDLKPAQLLLKVYLGFFILLLISLALLPIPNWMIVVLILLLSFYFQFMFRKHLLLNHPKSIDKLVFTDMDWCFVQLNNSKILKATILPETILTEHLVILNLKELSSQGFFSGNYHLLITATSVTDNYFWQLKRYLRLKKLNTHVDTKDDEI